MSWTNAWDAVLALPDLKTRVFKTPGSGNTSKPFRVERANQEGLTVRTSAGGTVSMRPEAFTAGVKALADLGAELARALGARERRHARRDPRQREPQKAATELRAPARSGRSRRDSAHAPLEGARHDEGELSSSTKRATSFSTSSMRASSSSRLGDGGGSVDHAREPAHDAADRARCCRRGSRPRAPSRRAASRAASTRASPRACGRSSPCSGRRCGRRSAPTRAP